ncbi:DUF1642 domain-containing protein [Enterococcus sp. AZ126]|uniref:DUF1642 domain-containing protein n=1 Tax=Enterococcus sp. AZ126 TaxID=2774635 RepID=UPI003F25FAF7
MKFIITTDNKEQGWLDAFNSHCKSNYKMGQFTEQEIKAIGERYWAFAVPVEGEEN